MYNVHATVYIFFRFSTTYYIILYQSKHTVNDLHYEYSRFFFFFI